MFQLFYLISEYNIFIESSKSRLALHSPTTYPLMRKYTANIPHMRVIFLNANYF